MDVQILTEGSKYIPAGVMVRKQMYRDGNVSLEAFDLEDGSPWGTLTVNIPETNINPNHVWIKDWSENAGVLDALIKSGLVKSLDITQPCGHCEAHLVELTF